LFAFHFFLIIIPKVYETAARNEFIEHKNTRGSINKPNENPFQNPSIHHSSTQHCITTKNTPKHNTSIDSNTIIPKYPIDIILIIYHIIEPKKKMRGRYLQLLAVQRAERERQ
jgi:hypothetical protein